MITLTLLAKLFLQHEGDIYAGSGDVWVAWEGTDAVTILLEGACVVVVDYCAVW